MDRLKEAYSRVLNDMLNSECGLLVGKYDAKNGDPAYMYGISTVMEWIAYRISDEDGDAFSAMFIKNMIESKESVDK